MNQSESFFFFHGKNNFDWLILLCIMCYEKVCTAAKTFTVKASRTCHHHSEWGWCVYENTAVVCGWIFYKNLIRNDNETLEITMSIYSNKMFSAILHFDDGSTLRMPTCEGMMKCDRGSYSQ